MRPMLKDGKDGLTVAQESYVECIAEAEAKHGHAHVSLLAEDLEISKPSVVQMIAKLTKLGIVKRQEKEITLTRPGKRLAGELCGKHALLESFMTQQLGMSEKVASKEACHMEHIVSKGFVRGLRTFLRNDN